MAGDRDNASAPPKPTGGRCPICRQPTVLEFRPFCSRRCADVDLARWVNGVYAIPVQDADDDEDGDQQSHSRNPGSRDGDR